MTETANTVITELQLELVVPGGPSLPVSATAAYRVDDPWAVRFGFRTGGAGDGVIEWMFARQLLGDGLDAPTGEGDVRVWPSVDPRDRSVWIAMASPSGSAVFQVGRDELVAFLQATYLRVPAGAESLAVDLEAELALFLLTD